MNEQAFLLMPRDPIIVRDGRPFSADPGARAVSLPWPLPSTLAGATRTCIGNTAKFDWSNGGPKQALAIPVSGPLMAVSEDGANWEVYFDAPADAVPFRPENVDRDEVMPLRPWKLKDPLCNLPLPEGLLPLKVTRDEKPAKDYDYWSMTDTVNWLCGHENVPNKHFGKLPTESRVHVKIDAASGTGEQGMLFSTKSICFADAPAKDKRGKAIPRVAMLCRAKTDVVLPVPSFVPFGGEKRVASIVKSGIAWPEPPADLITACKAKGRLKLQLVTPGLFANGWKPGWIGEDWRGSPPCCPNIKVRLVSAAMGRRIPVSGWSLKPLKATGKPGPKAARYAVPAGGVFFFEVEEGQLDETILRSLWLASICDNGQDVLDGFGLVVPGTWDYAEDNNAR